MPPRARRQALWAHRTHLELVPRSTHTRITTPITIPRGFHKRPLARARPLRIRRHRPQRNSLCPLPKQTTRFAWILLPLNKRRPTTHTLMSLHPHLVWDRSMTQIRVWSVCDPRLPRFRKPEMLPRTRLGSRWTGTGPQIPMPWRSKGRRRLWPLLRELLPLLPELDVPAGLGRREPSSCRRCRVRALGTPWSMDRSRRLDDADDDKHCFGWFALDPRGLSSIARVYL